MTADTVFANDRIRIRPWREGDADRLLGIHRREDVVTWLGDQGPIIDLDEAHTTIRRWNDRNAEDPRFGLWAIERVDTGLASGTVLLLPLPNGDGEIEVGWRLHPDSQGHGYASESARTVLAKAFAGGLDEVYAVTHPDNEPSQRVCRRLGMADLGIVERWHQGSSHCFRITRAEWDLARPVYESERIRLRPYRAFDADRVLDIQGRMDVIRWLDDPPHVPMQTRDEAVAWIERWAAARAEDPRVNGWAIEVKAVGVIAGTALLAVVPNSDGLMQIGWHLHPDSTGHGYVTEAARALLAKGFADGLPEIYALMFPDNAPSAAVCRRLGMTDLGLISKWYDGESLCFRLTRGEWEAPRHSP